MKALVWWYFWWPSLDEMIETCIKKCKTSSEPKHACISTYSPLGTNNKTMVSNHIDFTGACLGKITLVLTDTYSKWMDINSMSDIKAVTLIDALHVSFATHGLPYIIVSDNGPLFTSKEFKNFIHENGIKHITTAPYHPSSNGTAERAVQTFKSAMYKIVAESSNVPIKVLMSYCNRHRKRHHQNYCLIGKLILD